MSGWGSGPWGAGPWGAGAGVGAFGIVQAVAIRENVVRVTFTETPLFDAILTANDASNPARFTITPVAGTFGMDELPTRPVNPVRVEVAAVELSFGAVLDVTVDRPFSPTPSQYIIAANGLVSTSGALLDPSASSAQFTGLYRAMRVQSATAPIPSRDMANPQTYSGLVNAGSSDPYDADQLGTFPIDATGDYAFDDGLAQVKKRIIRRLMTRPGTFPSAPEYGVGIPSYGKQLGSLAIRQRIAAEAQKQISAEPEVADASINLVTDPANPNVTILRIRVRLNGSGGSTQFDVPFAPVG